jgi:thymidylate synthase (FAD)
MRVTLLAHTKLTSSAVSTLRDEPFGEVYAADHIAELAGRACYESFSRPNPATASNASYLASILSKEHYSVLEHASATFYVQDVSRTLTHELVRHRHLSYSQRSQRYVDESQSGYVEPTALHKYPALRARLDKVHSITRGLYEEIVKTLTDDGMSRKEARGAARAALINATHTSIVVSGNMRAWRDFLSKRFHPAAEVEIRTLATCVLIKLKEIAPSTFQDFSLSPKTEQAVNVDVAKGESWQQSSEKTTPQ